MKGAVLANKGSGNTQGRGSVSATKVVEIHKDTQGSVLANECSKKTQGRGSVSARKAVETHRAKAVS